MKFAATGVEMSLIADGVRPRRFSYFRAAHTYRVQIAFVLKRRCIYTLPGCRW